MFHHNACILKACASTLDVSRDRCRCAGSAAAKQERAWPLMLEDPSAQRVVELYDGILKSRGRALSPASVILDYGCGSGRHAYEFLDAGFPHVSGYDVQDYV